MSKMFQIVNVANQGQRGRPPMPRKHVAIKNRVLNAKGAVLGDLSMEPTTDGGVQLVAVVNGRKKVITFPPAAPKAKRTVKKATKASDTDDDA